MRLNDTVIATPMDNPGQYDPDWRNLVALGLVDTGGRIDPEYAGYRSDPWVKRQLSYLRAVARGLPLTKEQKLLRLAMTWFQGSEPSDIRFRLEPLLLTAARYETIALDLLGSCDDVWAIEAYEKIYFNIRDDKGNLSKSCQLRQYFALPSGVFGRDTTPEQMWKLVGSLMGYDTLVAVWLWKDAHGIVNSSQEYLLDEMWRLAQSRLFMSMFADRVGHESMAKLLSAISAQQKLIHEGKSAGAIQDQDVVRAMQGILGMASPRVIDAVAMDVDKKGVEDPTASRLRAESAVAAVELDEIGKNGVRLIGKEDVDNVI